MTGQSPAQASIAPSPLRQEPHVPQPSMGAPYAPLQQGTMQEKQEPNKSTTVNNRFPVVKIGRLSVSSLYHSNIALLIFYYISHLFFSKEGLLKKHEFPNDERSRKNSTLESDSDDNLPLKAKSSVSVPPVDKEREAIDIAREKNWEAVKRKHEEASRKEEAEATIGMLM